MEFRGDGDVINIQSCISDAPSKNFTESSAPNIKIFTCNFPQPRTYINIGFEGNGVDALNVFDIQVHGASFGKDGFLRDESRSNCLYLRS